MSNADANRTGLRYVAETTWGTTPATPTMQALRFTGESLDHNVGTVKSNEIRSDRNSSDLVAVSMANAGGFNFELSYGTLDTILESVFFNPWDTNVLKNGVTQKSLTIERAHLDVMQFFRFPGMVANTFNLDVTAEQIVTGSVDFLGKDCTLAQTSLAANIAAVDFEGTGINDATSGGTYTGSTEITYRVQIDTVIAPTDTFKWSKDGGSTWSTPSVAMTAGIAQELDNGVTVTFAAATGHTATDYWDIVCKADNSAAATTTTPFNATSNVGTLKEGDETLSGVYLRSIKLTINNNLRNKPAIGHNGTIEIGVGECAVSGSIEAYFANNDIWDKYKAGTASALEFTVTDAANNSYKFEIPNLKYTAAKINSSGKNQDVMASLTFEGLYDSDDDASIVLTRTQAA